MTAAPATSPPSPPAVRRKSSTRAPEDAQPLSLMIVNRPPVRREVRAKTRVVRPAPAKALAVPATPDPQHAAIPAPVPTSPAAQANPVSGSPAIANSAPVPVARKSWPVVVGGTAATGVAVVATGSTAGTAVSQPVVSPHAAAAQVAPPQPAGTAGWSDQEINEAKAHCAVVLKGVDAVKVPDDPIKDGACGSPVIFKVSSISKSPAVELSPPVQLTCDMIASLDKWIKSDVQPKARALLGGSIVKIDTMSSYSCRNAYGRTKSRLSEHGKANAIDIGGFATAKDTTTVLAGWGPTLRELKAIAAAKAEAERVAAQKAQQAPTASSGGLPKVVTVPPADASSARPAIPGVIITVPGASQQPGTGLGIGPNRLGGPKAKDAAPAVPSGDARSRFLKEVHAAACKHFGTVLGPEANNAHKNHFHLDRAQRTRSNFCE